MWSLPRRRRLAPSDEPASVPHVRGSTTSREAAESVRGSLGRVQTRVHDYVTSRGDEGSTCDEAELALGIKHQTCSARFRELERRGLLAKNGEKRPTQRGRPAAVYVLGDGRPPPPGSGRAEPPPTKDWSKPLDPQQTMILAYVAGVNGSTCDEVEYSLALTHQCASARVRELVRKGRLSDSGERRRTRSGRTARVYVVATSPPEPVGSLRRRR